MYSLFSFIVSLSKPTHPDQTHIEKHLGFQTSYLPNQNPLPQDVYTSFQTSSKNIPLMNSLADPIQQPSLPIHAISTSIGPTLSNGILPKSEVTTCMCRTGCVKLVYVRNISYHAPFSVILAIPASTVPIKKSPFATIDLTKDCDGSDATAACVPGRKKFTETQRQNILTGKWLDDILINMGQDMLCQQHPQILGLQSVLLGQNFGFSPQTSEFVQILHQNENHWITVSTIGCTPSTVNVYDNLHGHVSMHTKRIIADILQSPKSSISLILNDVQVQANQDDCGLFALANASALCNGIDPCTIVYTQSAMREHLCNCFHHGAP